MTLIETFIEGNKHFAAQQSYKGLTMMPKLRTMIFGCVDPRVDPAELLHLNPGEAVIIRNIGGRVTPATVETLAMLRTLSQTGATSQTGQSSQAGATGQQQAWNIVVLHHTDCGIRRLVNASDMLAGYFGVPKEELAQKAVSDPYAAVSVDVAALRTNVPQGFLVSGIVYDVDSGLIDVVEPPISYR